VRKIYWPC